MYVIWASMESYNISPMPTDFHDIARDFTSYSLLGAQGLVWSHDERPDWIEWFSSNPRGKKNIGKSLVDSTWISTFKVSTPSGCQVSTVSAPSGFQEKGGFEKWLSFSIVTNLKTLIEVLNFFENRASVRCDMQKTSQEVPGKPSTWYL